jgi:GNAT superfamily N-acetyltransferase
MGKISPSNQSAPVSLYSVPVPITAQHDVSGFDCGKPLLNDWLAETAIKAKGKSARCYVVTWGGIQVVGYYCISAGSVLRDDAPKPLSRNMPKTIPVIVMGRLAVDQKHQRRGLGSGLIADAFKRILHASSTVGVRAVIVHAIDLDAVPFSLDLGFKPFANGSLTLWLPISSIIHSLAANANPPQQT